MQQEQHTDADQPRETLAVCIQDLKDWIREEIRQLADHFGREFKEHAGQPSLEYLSVKQAARVTGLSECRIREALNRHELAASNIGSDLRPVYRIARADLDKWLEVRRSGGPSFARAELRALVEKQLPGLFKKSS
jgi:excisionase family DNA binding protein